MEVLLSNLPFALLFLMCPLMMLFMHRSGAHDGRCAERQEHHTCGATERVADQTAKNEANDVSAA